MDAQGYIDLAFIAIVFLLPVATFISFIICMLAAGIKNWINDYKEYKDGRNKSRSRKGRKYNQN